MSSKIVLHSLVEVDRSLARNTYGALLKEAAKFTHTIGSSSESQATGIRYCPYLASAIRRDTIWFASAPFAAWEVMVKEMLAFLDDFLALEPQDDPDRVVVIVLPLLTGQNDEEMNQRLDEVTTSLGLGGYYDNYLMVGGISLPLPPPPRRATFLLPLLICRHLIEADAAFINEGSTNPAKAAGARAAFVRRFGREP